MDICQIIIKNVENKSPPNNYAETPLHLAAKYGSFDICKLILENIENKHSIDIFGFAPKTLVPKMCHETIQLFEL